MFSKSKLWLLLNVPSSPLGKQAAITKFVPQPGLLWYKFALGSSVLSTMHYCHGETGNVPVNLWIDWEYTRVFLEWLWVFFCRECWCGNVPVVLCNCGKKGQVYVWVRGRKGQFWMHGREEEEVCLLGMCLGGWEEKMSGSCIIFIKENIFWGPENFP